MPAGPDRAHGTAKLCRLVCREGRIEKMMDVSLSAAADRARAQKRAATSNVAAWARVEDAVAVEQAKRARMAAQTAVAIPNVAVIAPTDD